MDSSVPTDIAQWAARSEPSQSLIPTEAVSGPSPAEKLAILKARALEVAKAPEANDTSTQLIEVTEFRLGEETYGFVSTSVREVYSLKGITSLPCTPAFILGVINVRGRILPIIDMKPLFGLPSSAKQILKKAVIIHAEGMEVGLLADTIIGVRTIAKTAIHPPLPTLTESQSRYIRGMTSDGTTILDATHLLTGSRFGVRE